ncbi:hypothetical protein Dred_0834 [Desulforamulus reducens MI-1]|uniref:DUF4878 domain-containing protein n=1 Tax=Desulforamulus reducens (strain ATCC BAA-1160 / DSM 100696 / MI-1) TaxID=349161 RepID=A4J2R9_DESRM|nr:hypothetical protein [Desulforamulus reducens]ABO49372.1 hypothetical protein Dred_0834 [Desulforamulus reducens MI-1]
MKNKTFIFITLFLILLSITVMMTGYLIKKDSINNSPSNIYTENQVSKAQRIVEYTRQDGQKVNLLVDFQKTDGGWKMTSMQVK